MISVASLVESVPPTLAYLVIGGVVLAEAVLFIGPFVPTFTTLLTAGAMVRTGHLEPIVVVGIAVIAVVVGDFFSHRAGRTIGSRSSALVDPAGAARVPSALWERASAGITRFGGKAVLVSRFVPVARTFVPYLVGVSAVPYRAMAPFSVIGAVVWASGEVAIGYIGLDLLQELLSHGAPVAVTAAVVVVAAVIVKSVRGTQTGATAH